MSVLADIQTAFCSDIRIETGVFTDAALRSTSWGSHR